MSTLVIVPCGRAKVWDRRPRLGPVPARLAYTGGPFCANRKYAEWAGGRWVILSAKYGFVWPDFVIPGPYEVTFKDPATGPVSVRVLRGQVREMGLGDYDRVVGLGGAEYRDAVGRAFAGLPAVLEFPFAGLPVGKAMSAALRASRRRHKGFLF